MSVLTVNAIQKSFGPLRVLDEVSFSVAPGECVALCGENGAGKSTLLRILMGLEKADAGSVDAPSGIGMVHQHFSLVPALSVAENVWLGAEPISRFGLFDRHKAEADTAAMAKELGWPLDPSAIVETLAVGERQRVEVLKALRTGTKLLLLDEPTAVLTSQEVDGFLRLVATLAERGTAIVFVSHKLHEVARACSRALVLRKGKIVAEHPAKEVDAIAGAMIGQTQPVTTTAAAASAPHASDIIFGAEGIAAQHGSSRLEHATFSVKPGEILGIAGVDGNGQDALFAAVTGQTRVSRGTLNGLADGTIASRRARGLRCVPADRHRDALLPGRNLRDNLVLGHEALFGYGSDRFHTTLGRWDVRPAEPQRDVMSLSGGNQQKLLFGRELEAEGTRLLVLHEPTRGVDWAARERIWDAVRRVASAGAAVVLLSSDLDELRALCGALGVLYRGRLSPPATTATLSDEAIGRLMAGLA